MHILTLLGTHLTFKSKSTSVWDSVIKQYPIIGESASETILDIPDVTSVLHSCCPLLGCDWHPVPLGALKSPVSHVSSIWT